MAKNDISAYNGYMTNDPAGDSGMGDIRGGDYCSLSDVRTDHSPMSDIIPDDHLASDDVYEGCNTSVTSNQYPLKHGTVDIPVYDDVTIPKNSDTQHSTASNEDEGGVLSRYMSSCVHINYGILGVLTSW